ncbi:MATE family efflux transporter [Mariniplasma anaerobium]|uniref:Oligosaccharide transporter n=1 Tax=Mariniplasma anaerobium TaxID=2735436 RepID=A0A7U9XVU2_9MOLU|nr:sugar translocase [Mariniplasma anaerobium]BCR36090.1 oligosaccharide transporter [Mariniplasma anaerobium]
MRTLNSFKNLFSGAGGSILKLILQFISRTFFIYYLGKEYLGIYGLFSNILQVFNITELGIGTAIIYSLYSPLAKKDKAEITSRINYLRKAYFYVGLLVLVLGLAIFPFLPYLIKGETTIVNINLFYLLYLLQSLSSYWFFAYKSSILKADQKYYLFNLYSYISYTFLVAVQIIVLITLQSFLIYTIFGVLYHLLLNIFTSKKVDKLYPYLKNNKKILPDEAERKKIKKNIIGLSIYKINSTITRSTDSIVISAFIGLAMVGIYSNYLLIVNSVYTIARVIFTSFVASVGNVLVTDERKKNKELFSALTFLSYWVFAVFSIMLYSLISPFIELWVGESYVFSEIITIVIIFNFLLDGFSIIPMIYKDASGIFWLGKYRPLFTAILNIIFSLILVKYMGVAGVLLATIISRLLTTWWYDPILVNKNVFKQSSKKYFFDNILFTILTVLIAIIVSLLKNQIFNGSITSFVLLIAVSMIVPNVILIVLFFKRKELKFIYKRFRLIFSKKI